MDRSRRQFAIDTGALTVGTVVGGFAAYGFIVVGTRSLGAEAFAPISILWTFWAASAAFMTFPVQHWAIRTIESDGSDERVRSAIPVLALTAATVAVSIGLGAWLGRRSLFGDPSVTYPLLAAVIPFGSAAVGLVRGILAGRRRFGQTAAVIAGENLLRVIGAIFLAVFGGGAVAFGLVLVVGFSVALLHPDAFVLPGSLGDARRVSPLAFLTGVAVGSFIGQVVLTGGPVILAVLGGTPASVTSMFSALALFRAPYMVATGVAVRITGVLTGLVNTGREDALHRIRIGTMMLVGLGSLVAGLFGFTVGDPVLRLVFGPGVSLGGRTTAIVAAGSIVALGTLFTTLSLVAKARTKSVTLAWIGATVMAALWVVVASTQPVARVAEAFLIAESGALTIMLVADRTPVAARSSHPRS